MSALYVQYSYNIGNLNKDVDKRPSRMELKWPMAALLLLSVVVVSIGPIESKEITHEDIKDAMLSLVHLMRDNTEKLERHEARDRQTDEQLKKAIALLTKRVSSIDALKSYLVKVEERVAGIEQLIAQRDERERIQIQKTADTLEDLESRLEGWATEIESKVMEGASRVADRAPEILSRIEAAESKLNDGIAEALRRPAAAHLLHADEVRELGDKIGKLENACAQAPRVAASATPAAAAAAAAKQDRLQELLETTVEQIRHLPRFAELQAMHNESQMSMQQTGQLLKDAISRANEAVESSLSESKEQMITWLKSDLADNAQRISKELQELGKGQSVMMEMADHVLDTKKRLEHAYKILREVGELVMAQGLNINNTLNARFDGISGDIMDNQKGAFANLTVKMEQEMNQVWRQINVMYQQMMESAKALDKLHKQNEAYVNGTTETMDGMEGKVGEITKRMSEVDTNLNYLLGRLSLVTQEFNQIKQGLGAALDNIKASFKEVQQKANDLSPGPHALPRNYNEPAAEPTAFSVNLPSSRR